MQTFLATPSVPHLTNLATHSCNGVTSPSKITRLAPQTVLDQGRSAHNNNFCNEPVVVNSVLVIHNSTPVNKHPNDPTHHQNDLEDVTIVELGTSERHFARAIHRRQPARHRVVVVATLRVRNPPEAQRLDPAAGAAGPSGMAQVVSWSGGVRGRSGARARRRGWRENSSGK